ncbi:MAG: hypothetical protein ACRESZ_11090 [Methylococcales bacterium]
MLTDLTEIVHANYTVSKHGDATEQILKGLLATEVDRQTTDAGQGCAHVETECSRNRYRGLIPFDAQV